MRLCGGAMSISKFGGIGSATFEEFPVGKSAMRSG